MFAIGLQASAAFGQNDPQQPGSPLPPQSPPQPYQSQGSPAQQGARPQPDYAPPQGYPPPGGYPPNYAPPGAQQQQQPAPYSQPPPYGQGQGQGYGGYNEPPIPPPPKRKELEWSIRFQVLDLLFGRVTGEVEYAFAGPFSIALVPEYVFSNPSIERTTPVTAKGAGLAGEFGFWVEGRPLRGYFLKAHGGHRSITYSGPVQDVAVPATQFGAMFGSQSIYGGWFTLSGGIGVLYDFQSKDRPIVTGYEPSGRPVGYIIGASGIFGNGFDLLAQLSIGGSF